MSFIVRQIALKSSGEEIVRSASYDIRELTVGRDTACAVHLPDLAVNPVHARIALAQNGRLVITAATEQPFTADGRSTLRAEIDPAVGGELALGGHRIAISLADDGKTPVLAVRRVEALSDSAEDRDLADAYSLRGLLPGKRISAWGFALLVLFAFLALPIYSYATYKPLAMKADARRPQGFHADQTWSSGPLSLSHKALGQNCQSCHTQAFVAVTDNACLTCHGKDAHDHVADKARLMQARGEPSGMAAVQRAVAGAFNRPTGRCVDCHTEHEGAGAMPATRQQFCADCHDGMKARLPDTKIADAADFGTAHPQFRPALVAGVERGKPVLRRTAWSKNLQEDNGLKFTHGQHLSKTNGIAQMVRRMPGRFAGADSLQCADCHRPDSAGVRFQPVKMEQACQSCHALGFERIGGTVRTLRHGEPELVVADLRAFYRDTAPVRPANLSGMARRVPGDAALAASAADYARAVRFHPASAGQAIDRAFSKGGMCHDCHVVTRGGTAATGGYLIQPVAQNERYFRKGWFDHKAHRKTDCTYCHASAATSMKASDVLVPGIDGKGGCRTCHVGGEGARLAGIAVKDPVESSCAMCHSYHMDDDAPWLPKGKRPKQDTNAPAGANLAIAGHPRLTMKLH